MTTTSWKLRWLGMSATGFKTLLVESTNSIASYFNKPGIKKNDDSTSKVGGTRDQNANTKGTLERDDEESESQDEADNEKRLELLKDEEEEEEKEADTPEKEVSQNEEEEEKEAGSVYAVQGHHPNDTTSPTKRKRDEGGVKENDPFTAGSPSSVQDKACLTHERQDKDKTPPKKQATEHRTPSPQGANKTSPSSTKTTSPSSSSCGNNSKSQTNKRTSPIGSGSNSNKAKGRQGVASKPPPQSNTLLAYFAKVAK